MTELTITEKASQYAAEQVEKARKEGVENHKTLMIIAAQAFRNKHNELTEG